MPPPEPDRRGVAEPTVRQRRRISTIWIVPIVAGLLGIWLAVTTLHDKGPTINVTFDTADGLEAGKTKIKYKDVEIGQVSEVHFDDKYAKVVAVAEINKASAGLMTSGTRFWIVRPQLGISGVSGLGTLLSGTFIEIDPGQGATESSFTGLEEPPPLRSDTPGQRYVLHSKTLGSISRGAPINFLGINIGRVLDYRLNDQRRGLLVDIFVDAPHDQLIRKSSRFWNASGIDVSVGGGGVNVKLASLRSMLIGGIDVETPDLDSPGEASPAGAVFELYDTHDDVLTAGYTERIPLLAYFQGSVRGLKVGAPVEFSGLQVGAVTGVSLEYDQDLAGFRIPVRFDLEPNRVRAAGQKLVNADPYDTLEAFVAKGMRAQLKSGNLLTGELIVSLEFVKDAAPASMKRDGADVELPTVANDMDQMTASVQGFVDQLSRLDLPDLIGDVRKTVQRVDALVGSQDVQNILAHLDQSLAAVARITTTVDGQAGPLVASMRQVADETADLAQLAQITLRSANGMISEQSPTRMDMNMLMKELTSATRSIRLFADYLDRHPEALIRGKAGGNQ